MEGRSIIKDSNGNVLYKDLRRQDIKVIFRCPKCGKIVETKLSEVLCSYSQWVIDELADYPCIVCPFCKSRFAIWLKSGGSIIPRLILLWNLI